MSNETGFVADDVLRVKQVGSRYIAYAPDGSEVGTAGLCTRDRKQAFERNMALQRYVRPDGSSCYKKVAMSVFDSLVKPLSSSESAATVSTKAVSDSLNEVRDFISKSPKLRPDRLFMSDLNWRYLVRSAVRAKNILMTGPAGCGKTFAAKSVIKALGRPSFYFNLGSTQDPRATLVGSTQFNPESGTVFKKSEFVTAIETPNAMIMLDELSRAHPDAWNILMTVLDEGQRYLRLDEAPGSPIVNVAEGVTFIGTANIGSEYTSTRVIDRAMLDRFVIVEMPVLNDEQELKLLKMLYPEAPEDDLKAIAEIAHATREQVKNETGKVSEIISTRVSVEAGGLILDGFSLPEAAEIAFYPFFSDDGGLESERTFVKQLVQKYIKVEPEKSDNSETKSSSDKLFDSEEKIPVF